MPDFNPNILVAAKTNTALVSGLKPNTTYTAQVSVEGFKAPDGSLIGDPWSASLTFTTITDVTAPATPSNFSVELLGEDFVATWDAPTTNEDATPLGNDFAYYVLEFYDPADVLNKQEYFLFYEETKFELPLPLNRLLFGVPKGNLTFAIRSRDLSGNESVPAEITVGGTPPEPPVLEAPSGASVTTVKLRWNNDRRVNYYTIHRGPSNGSHTDAGWQMVSSVSPVASDDPAEVILYYDLPDPGTYWYIVVAHNSFGLTAPSNSVQGTAGSPVSDDAEIIEVAPDVPSAAIQGDEHYFTINDYDVSSMTPVPRFIEFEASSLQVGPFESVGRVVVGEGGLVNARFIWVVSEEQSVWVRARGSSLVPASPPPSFSVAAQSQTPVKQGGFDFLADFAVSNAKIQNLDASKITANTAFTNNLNVESIFTLASGGIMKSSLYTPGDSGWYLDSTGFAELNDLILRGNIEATSGYLDTVNVRNILTVGDGGIAGSIQSSNYTGSQGWRIQSDGSVDFHNGNFRGYINATSGFLGPLTVNGQLTMSSGSGSIVHSGGGYNLNANGTASFGGTLTTGGNLVINGSMFIYGTSNLYSTLHIRAGGRIDVGNSTARATLEPTGAMQFYYGSQRWSISATNQGQILMQAHNNGYGVAFRVSSYQLNAYRFQVGIDTVVAMHMHNSELASLRTVRSGITMGPTMRITSGSGFVWYTFGSDRFLPRVNFGASIGSSDIAFNYVYARYLRYASNSFSYSDLRLKNSVEPSGLGLEFISSLRPVKYRLNHEDDGVFHHGLIAQDVKDSMDEFGLSEYDFSGYNDPEVTKEEGQEFLSLDYIQFMAPLINSVQELASRLERLEARLDSA